MKLLNSLFTHRKKQLPFEVPTDLNDAVTRVGNLILSKDVVVLCGAGISRNSGFPLANELKRTILEEVFRREKDTKYVETILGSNMPFETFIECIASSEEIDERKDIRLVVLLSHMFNNSEYSPNVNHTFISRLAKHGLLKIIATTNFDTLFEKAFESENLLQNKGYKKYSTPTEHFSYTNSNSFLKRHVSLLKLHGCAESGIIAITLRRISSSIASFPLSEIIEQLFSKGKHQSVIIVGYSCSDIFDIMPKIRSITRNRKELFYIQHSDTRKIEYVTNKSEGNPFYDFPCTIVQCNTDDFIAGLWKFLEHQIGSNACSQRAQNINWKSVIHTWGYGIDDEFLDNYIKGSLFLETPQYPLASLSFEKAFHLIEAKGRLQPALNCCMALLEAYLFQGHHEKMLTYISKAMHIYEEINRKWKQEPSFRISVKGVGRNYSFVMIESAINIKAGEAILLQAEGNAQFAKEYFERALRIEEQVSLERDRIFICHEKLSKCYATLTDFNNARKFCDMLKSDNPIKSAVYFDCKGFIHYKRKEYERALESYKESLYLNEITGNIYGQADSCLSLGDVYDELCDFGETLSHYSKAIDISERIGANLLASKGYGYLGFLYFNVREFDLSLKNHKKCLEIENQLMYRPREGISYMNVASAFAQLGNLEDAIKHYLAAEKILSDTGQKEAMSHLYANISLAYKRMGDFGQSEVYKHKGSQ